MNIFSKVFGTRSEHEVKRIMPLVEKTESLRPEMQKLTVPELIGSRILVTQNRNLMLNQRMLKNRNVFLILKIHFVISFFLVFCFCYYIYSLDFTKTPRLWSPSGFTPNW